MLILRFVLITSTLATFNLSDKEDMDLQSDDKEPYAHPQCGNTSHNLAAADSMAGRSYATCNDSNEAGSARKAERAALGYGILKGGGSKGVGNLRLPNTP